MAIKFKEVIEIEPWDKFADENGDVKTSEVTIDAADAVVVAKAYHEWLEKQNPKVGACILCERKFKPRIDTKEKTDTDS